MMSLKTIKKILSVARGEQPADMVITNAKVINVFNGQIEESNIAIVDGHIAGIGDYTEARAVSDLMGKYVAPGFINGHVHIESSMVDVPEYSRAIVPRGTTGVVTDLHELANVLGKKALEYVAAVSSHLPLDIYFMAPSCVPSSRFETSGAGLDAGDLTELLKMENILGLGEVMDYPAVINGEERLLGKIETFQDRIIDGHAPGITGNDLNAYIAAGIRSDHECVTLEEAREKLARGMYIMIREGSNEKNLEALLPLVNDQNYKRCMLVTDDRTIRDIFREGDMDWVVYRAIKLGMDPVRAIQMATINTAEYFGIKKVGAVAPGYYANIVTFADLQSMEPEDVLFHGYLIGRNKEANFTPRVDPVSRPVATVNIKPLKMKDLELKAEDKDFPVVNIVPGQITTKKTMEKAKTEDGLIVADTERDLLKMVVVERHFASGNIGRGLVKGLGLRKGAVACSVAHDAHNIIAIGTNDGDILAAVKAIANMQGGLVMVLKGEVIGSLPLPVGGLLSVETAEDTAGQLDDMETLLKVMGVKPESPFSAISFLALPVIPEMRITDQGIVDVAEQKIIE